MGYCKQRSMCQYTHVADKVHVCFAIPFFIYSSFKMFKFFSLGAMIAAVSAQTSWWTDPKAVVTAANVEFATFFNAGNFTACAGTWVQRSHCYTILLFFCIYLNITNMYRSDTCAQCTPWSTGTARPSFYRCLINPRTHARTCTHQHPFLSI